LKNGLKNWFEIDLKKKEKKRKKQNNLPTQPTTGPAIFRPTPAHNARLLFSLSPSR
jgi:hypothetical protein